MLSPSEVDDAPLHRALSARGVVVEHPVWDDKTVDFSRFDAVLIRTTWDYQDKLPAFLSWVDRVGGVTQLFNPAPVVRWNTHKHYLRALEAEGVAIIPTVWLAQGERVDVASWVERNGWQEGFIKPCVGSTARETLRFARDAQGLPAAQAHVDRLLPSEDLMLQPFLASVTKRGEWSAIFVDGQITHCVRKIPVAGDYRVQDDFGARDEPYTPTPSERAAAEHAMSVVQRADSPCPGVGGAPLLYGRADFLWADDGSCLLTELELVEPSLFFRHAPEASETLANALLRRVREVSGGHVRSELPRR